jgi:hypothetical protein
MSGRCVGGRCEAIGGACGCEAMRGEQASDGITCKAAVGGAHLNGLLELETEPTVERHGLLIVHLQCAPSSPPPPRLVRHRAKLPTRCAGPSWPCYACRLGCTALNHATTTAARARTRRWAHGSARRRPTMGVACRQRQTIGWSQQRAYRSINADKAVKGRSLPPSS